MPDNQLSDEELDDVVDCAYKAGKRRAWKDFLSQVLRDLGVDDPLAARTRWVLEREEAVSALRDACKEHGDNSWPDDMHLGDVITKHLFRIAESTR